MNIKHRGSDHAGVLVTSFERWLGAISDVSATSRSWASATFAGTRHTLSFSVGHDADVTRFAQEIGEAELPLRRAFVADVAVRDSEAAVDGGMRLTIDVLVIDEA